MVIRFDAFFLLPPTNTHRITLQNVNYVLEALGSFRAPPANGHKKRLIRKLKTVCKYSATHSHMGARHATPCAGKIHSNPDGKPSASAARCREICVLFPNPVHITHKAASATTGTEMGGGGGCPYPCTTRKKPPQHTPEASTGEPNKIERKHKPFSRGMINGNNP